MRTNEVFYIISLLFQEDNVRSNNRNKGMRCYLWKGHEIAWINVFQKKLMRNFFGWPLWLLSNHIKVAVFTSSFLPKLFSEDFSISAFFWSFWITHYSRISVEQLTMIRKLISSLKCPQVSFHKTTIIKNFPWLQFLWQLLKSYVCMFLHLGKPLCS